MWKLHPFLLYSLVRFSEPSLTIWQRMCLAESPELLQEINRPPSEEVVRPWIIVANLYGSQLGTAIAS